MNRSTRLRVPLLAALLAACSRPDTGELPLRITGHPAGALAPGDSLRMTAYLRNPGRQPVRLEFEDQCQVEFYVLAPDKTVLHPPGGGASCMGGPTVLEIAPGDSARFASTWLATSATAGPHTAYAVLWAHDLARGGAGEPQQGHRSNILQFEVKPGE